MTHGLTVHCSNQLSYFPNIVVGSGGFEPTEAETADLQSIPFELLFQLLRRQDSNLRLQGYEPCEIPSSPHRDVKKPGE